MKTRVVVFTENNARILINPYNLDQFRAMPNAVIDPDLSHVRGISPHFWKNDEGRIVPMSESERAERLKHLVAHGSDNVISISAARPRRPLWQVLEPVVYAVSGIFGLIALYLCLKGGN
jgi:hypothetical protein